MGLFGFNTSQWFYQGALNIKAVHVTLQDILRSHLVWVFRE